MSDQIGTAAPRKVTDNPPSSRLPPPPRRLLIWFIPSFICVGGYVLAVWADLQDKGTPLGTVGNNIYFYLQVNYETWQLLALFVFWILAAAITTRGSQRELPPRNEASRTWRLPCLVALVVLLLAAAGTFVVHRDFGLSIDEYLAKWQAAVFESGRIFAPISSRWQAVAPAMTTIYLMHDPEQHRWISCFLPIYSAIRAGFSIIHLESLTNAFLGAGSVLALFGASRNLFGREADARALGIAVLLAVSPQFLVNGMTSFAWPAHLFFNLLWLCCYTSPRRFFFWLTPLLGILAMGLHQPHVHALFAAPFVIRLLLQKRWNAFAWFSAFYLGGGILWMKWLEMARPAFATGGFEGVFGFPTLEVIALQWSNLTLMLAWCSPLLFVFAAFACWKLRELPATGQDLVLGILLTFGFYFLFPHNQGHGWGYRFAHSVLGNIALLAVPGMAVAARFFSRLAVRRLLYASVAFSVFWQLPARCYEVRQVVSPFADSYAYLKSLPEDIVVIDALSLWYSGDLVRNAPDLDVKPLLFFGYRLNTNTFAELQKLGTVRVVGEKELAPFGMFPTRIRELRQQ